MTATTDDTNGVVHFAEGSVSAAISTARAAELVDEMLAALKPLRRVLLIPPDFTRRSSGAGELTVLIYERLKGASEIEIMPALGTHTPMTAGELESMFPGIPSDVFRVHDWRNDLSQLGEVPARFVRQVTQGQLDFPIPCEVNRHLVDGRWDRIISLGQLVPHEVAGIANHSKNIFVGVGGQETINKTHYLGAVCGIETLMGQAVTPVRSVFDYMANHLAGDLPITYLLTVRARDASGDLVTRGMYAGDGTACFRRGADLCRQVNVELLAEPVHKAVVYLSPAEFRSTWLGNKAIYRTRMAMATGGELVILAPGVATFGEDPEVDRLIRAYGYRGTLHTLRMVQEHKELGGRTYPRRHT